MTKYKNKSYRTTSLDLDKLIERFEEGERIMSVTKLDEHGALLVVTESPVNDGQRHLLLEEAEKLRRGK